MKRLLYPISIGFVLIVGLVWRVDSQPTAPSTGTSVFGNNGTSADALRTAALANSYAADATPFSTLGALTAEKGPRWSVVGQGAAGVQETVNIAAKAGVRHVVDCISASAFSGAVSVTPSNTNIAVWDGTTGGTVIWSIGDTFATNAGTTAGLEITPVVLCGLNLVGTTNVAMTVGFSTSNAAVQQIVSFSGYDIQ